MRHGRRRGTTSPPPAPGGRTAIRATHHGFPAPLRQVADLLPVAPAPVIPSNATTDPLAPPLYRSTNAGETPVGGVAVALHPSHEIPAKISSDPSSAVSPVAVVVVFVPFARVGAGLNGADWCAFRTQYRMPFVVAAECANV